MLQRNQRLAIIGTCALLLVVVAVVFFQQAKNVQPATSTVPAQLTPAQISARYEVGLTQATTQLNTVLSHPLAASDQPQLKAVRDELVALSVPPAYQSYHLQLVLKLSLLDELLTPGQVHAAATGIPTVASTTLALQQLLKSGPSVAK